MNNLNKIQKSIIIAVIVLVIGIIGYYIYGREQEDVSVTNDEEIMSKPQNTEDEKNKKIVVHITGAIKNEGVFTLEENSRVTDAVSAAGGLTEDADMSKINLAYVLEDGVKIKIPSVNDEAEFSTDEDDFVDLIPDSSSKSEKRSNIVNINKATQTELETLPGIGPSTALKIINYREENGKFSSIDDLKSISGIGESKFEKIKDLISVR